MSITIEEATELALRAAEKDDVDGIRGALDARAAAIRELAGAPPTEEKARRIKAALEAGDELRGALLAIKYRAGLEYARLARLKTGIAAGIPTDPGPEIDYRG